MTQNYIVKRLTFYISVWSVYTLQHLKCIVSTYTLNTTTTKKKKKRRRIKAFLVSGINKGAHLARLEKNESWGSPCKGNSCRAETGTSADLPNSAQQELHKLPQRAHAEGRGKIQLQPVSADTRDRATSYNRYGTSLGVGGTITS